jgi:hypothetical protein
MDAISDLTGERDFSFRAAVLAREQPILIPASQQSRPEIENILIDQLREVPLQWVFQPEPVLDVVVRKNESIVRLWTARFE